MFIKTLANRVINGSTIDYEQARKLSSSDESDLSELLSAASKIRQNFRGKKVGLCSITNAKSGACSEDCSFCAQSRFHKTNTPTYPLIEPEEMLRRATLARNTGTERFCLVSSGASLNESEFDKICEGLCLIKDTFSNLKLDASLGFLTKDEARKLKQAGVSRYNHNLETSSDYFPKICTTHTYSQRLQTLRTVKQVGLEICCGGIFGLGEGVDDRLKLAFSLKELDVDCIPINLLNPISGTPLENRKKLIYKECLKIIAIFRFIHPAKEIKVCGGRETVLEDKQFLIFSAGADSIIFGDYLTTKGNLPSQDLEMIKQAGLKV